MKYSCDYCGFTTPGYSEIAFHELVCGVVKKFKDLGINTDFNEIENALISVGNKPQEQSEEDEAFGHPGMAQKLWICPKAETCKNGVVCGGHKVPHRHKGDECSCTNICCPACVEVKP